MSKLHAIKDRLIEVILEQHASTGNSDTPSLGSLQPEVLNNELTHLIEKTTIKDQANIPLLNFLRNISVLLNSFTHANAFLDEAQQSHVKSVLVELFTALSTLCETSQTSIHTSTSGIACHGFLNPDGTYSHIGEQISTRLKPLWNLEETKAEIDQIDGAEETNPNGLVSSKVDILLQDYQKEVEPAHLRVEIERLKSELAEIERLKSELAKKDEQITALICQVSVMQTKLTTIPTAARREPNPAQATVFGPLFRTYYPQQTTSARAHAATQTADESPAENQACAQQ